MREERDDQNRSDYDVEVGPARFQLQYMDYYLLREERNDPDPRVQHFIPDTWQVLRQIHLYIELLEAIFFHLKIYIIVLFVKSSVSLSLSKTVNYFRNVFCTEGFVTKSLAEGIQHKKCQVHEILLSIWWLVQAIVLLTCL